MSKQLEKFWKKLTEIRAFEFSSTCRMTPPSYSSRRGRGEVIVQNQEKERIVFFEKGRWKSSPQEEVSFSNVFRWGIDRKQSLISLEHLRFGVTRPVFIFYLMPVEENLLKSREPHECKEDTYFGSVLYDDHFIHLNWRIIGPTKNELICQYYTLS